MNRLIVKLGLFAVLTGVSAACGSSSDGTAGSPACIPNSTNACVGPNGCSGVQTCSAEGSGYSPCSCSSGVGGSGSTSGFGGSSGSGSGGSSGSAGTSSAGGSSGAPASCNLQFDDTACNTCFQNQCQNQCVACSGDAECMALNTCLGSCTTSSCIESCVYAHPSAAAAMDALIACAYGPSQCGPLCDDGRQTADACEYDYQCASGFCSSAEGGDGFCTQYCNDSDACGDYAWCVPSTSGNDICFPFCSSSSSCAYLGSGFSCQSTSSVEGYSVSVCGG